LRERYLLDTNVVSELMKDRPSPQVIGFFDSRSTESFFISDVILAELNFGIELTGSDERRIQLRQGLDHHIRPLFADRVLSATEQTWLIWKRFERDGKRSGYTFPQPDLVIAALAAQYSLVVVTRDGTPFGKAGVPTVNPWNG
jgi:toxin FitB